MATTVFAGSYLCEEARVLRRVQAAAAVLWVIYGGLVHAPPVVVANVVVAGVALGSSFGKVAASQSERRAPLARWHAPRTRAGCAERTGISPAMRP